LRLLIGILGLGITSLSPVRASYPASHLSGFVASVATISDVAQTEAPPAAEPSAQPDQGLAETNAVMLLLQKKQVEQALSAAQHQTQIHPERALAWYALGDVLLAEKRSADALDPLTKCTTLNPKMGPGWYALGNCLAMQGKYDEAVDALSKAIDRMPNYPPVWILFYRTYVMKHDPMGEEAKIRELIAAHPDSPYGWMVLGELQSAEGTPATALTSLQKVVALKADYAPGWNMLGIAYARTQQIDKALDSFMRSVAAQPGYDEALNNLGYTYAQMGQTDKAIEAYQQALRSNPKHKRALFNLTNAYASQKKWGLAKTTCNALEQVDPAQAASLNQKFPDMATATPVTPEVTPPAPTELAAAPLPASQTVSATPADAATESIGLAQLVVAPGILAAPTTPSAPAGAVQPGAPIQSTPSPAATVPASPAAPTLAVTAIQPLAPTPPAVSSQPATSSDSPASPGYTVGPVGAWVKPLDPDAVPVPPTTEVEGGMDYLLVDNQQLMEPSSSFSHFTRRLTSDQGLQNGSDVRAEFDPSYQTLTLHWLKIKRDGVWQDRLPSEKFQVLRREENLDSQMLDGRYSVVCHLQDVRAGDLVDFAYTVTGANPVFNGKYLHSFFTTWPSAVHRFSDQLTTAPNRTVATKIYGDSLEPTRTQNPDHSELIQWQRDEVPAIIGEERTPSWYNTFGWVQVSEFSSWKEVIDWGIATFAYDGPLSPELKSKIDEIAKAHADPEDRTLAVLDFVQNDIRYLGVEMGANSYRPTSPSLVCEHRFGDCKDKTLLCVTMLRALGIDANPALVNPGYAAFTAKLLPSPLAFDHAILQVTVNNRTYWIDSTATDQRGRLRDFYVGDFKQALVLKPGGDSLVPMESSPESMPRATIDETFTVKAMDQPAELEVHSIFNGYSAESIRSLFDIYSRQRIETDDLDHYARIFSKIKMGKPLRYQDFPEANRFETWQDYSVSDLWTRETPTTPWKATFSPGAIAEAVGTLPSPQRKAPLDLAFPVDISENLEVRMFDRWNLDLQPREITTPNFIFSKKPSFDDKIIHFDYHYKTLTPEVPLANMTEYADQVQNIQNHLSYVLTAPAFGVGSGAPYRLNWMVIIIAALILGVACYAGYRIYSIETDYVSSRGYREYDGIGGWLILIVIGNVIRIFMDAKMIWLLQAMTFNATRWEALTLPGMPAYSPLWAPMLLFELSCGIVFLVFSILVLILMLKKRFLFPHVMIAIIGASLVYQVIDLILVNQIAVRGFKPPDDSGVAVFRCVIQACIWIPYFLTSKRVKETFRY
jgi:tetratricopeptide (TPR) repeat protein/transglutaminase-like putative cysteine protease